MTIDEFKKNIAPYMHHGWIAMGSNKKWYYSEEKPNLSSNLLIWSAKEVLCLNCFDIEPVDNWKESLIEVGK